MNFGGNIVPVNCGPENEYAALWQAYYDMYWAAANEEGFFHQAYRDAVATVTQHTFNPDLKIDKTGDLYLALQTNFENLHKFTTTDEFKEWTAGKDMNELHF